MNYVAHFCLQTKFLPFVEMPAHVIDSIKLRYKMIFLREYVFCDHINEEFLNYLSTVGRG